MFFPLYNADPKLGLILFVQALLLLHEWQSLFCFYLEDSKRDTRAAI